MIGAKRITKSGKTPPTEKDNQKQLQLESDSLD